MKDKFIDFLIRKKAFDNYCSAFYGHSYNDNVYNKTIDRLLSSKHPSEYISDAFAWYESRKGFDFWDQMDNEWQKEIG